MLESVYTPGTRVRHLQHPEWGIGMVQTAINGRVTVSFEDRGKIVIDARHVTLEIISR